MPVVPSISDDFIFFKGQLNKKRVVLLLQGLQKIKT